LLYIFYCVSYLTSYLNSFILNKTTTFFHLENTTTTATGKITTHAERCGAFLSRLDGQTKQTLCNYDRHVKTNYNTLKDAFIKIFAKKKKTAQEYHADFLSCCKGDMNLYHYHAELCRLVKRAFPTLSERQRDEMIYERFTSGINNDIIRGQLLAS
jgi:hypothetical protein